MRRMLVTLRLLFAVVCVAGSFSGLAQSGVDYKTFVPPIKRQLFHDYVNREQKNALQADGKADNQFTGSANDEVNFLITQAITQKVDQLQYKIEKDSAIGHAKKVAYIRGLEHMLKNFTANYKAHHFNAASFPVAIAVYETAMEKDKNNESIEPIIEKQSFDVANLIVTSGAFDTNSDVKKARDMLVYKFVQLHPESVFISLKNSPDVPFRDSLILVGAYKYPDKLYDFAQAHNKLGNAIRNINDPLIKAVSKMAASGSGQLYFPFLDNIVKGKQSIEDINAVLGDETKYFKLLVKTRIDYVMRAINKDTAYGYHALMKTLEHKANDVFVKTINGLHEESDAVRFRILQPLNAQELYYVAVSSESEIYTSSYTKGVYPLMMQKSGNRGDSLLASVGFDRFKKFIKIAAGYNTLNDFLSSFPRQEDARAVMTAFINGLEKTRGLEDGVDVADSYVSIAERNKPLADYVLSLTKVNYDKNVAKNNEQGMVMYNLLHKLFLSADTNNNIDLSKEFGIPPVYSVSYKALAGDSNRIIMQVFFYGDKDGQNNYQGFIRQFSNGNWHISQNNQWVTINSIKGKPITIYANKPLPEETGEDAKAQAALDEYLSQKSLQPTIVVHRGHSYYADATIEQIQPSAKIVFLGSCGGYHLLHDVLSHAPDAHIIASKQIGKTIINQPFFNLLMEKLRNGNDIDWIPFWNEFGRMVTDKEGFEDYIPPQKNLGAIFIKAYKIAMGEAADEE